jgi:hypothetical protein
MLTATQPEFAALLQVDAGAVADSSPKGRRSYIASTAGITSRAWARLRSLCRSLRTPG